MLESIAPLKKFDFNAAVWISSQCESSTHQMLICVSKWMNTAIKSTQWGIFYSMLMHLLHI